MNDCVSRFLDMHIGIYFSDVNCREKETLGKFLYYSIKELMPTSFIEHLLNGEDKKDE